ncbi:hypothetical protein Sme01_06870 [Sphaerisporangium melleum]|uniref:Uncharacterized protein n=1 Tax=Sphaerisporangium melleum TaxID=321316 RepID=A0A917VFN8_9ACTN|nr:hypothetical protein GCM10007964_15330 [Sphaerisporangium melleum]GII68211.1 hypothetical protein Sme01_06870 [Sphaerisporangium melleum]
MAGVASTGLRWGEGANIPGAARLTRSQKSLTKMTYRATRGERLRALVGLTVGIVVAYVLGFFLRFLGLIGPWEMLLIAAVGCAAGAFAAVRLGRRTPRA